MTGLRGFRVVPWDGKYNALIDRGDISTETPDKMVKRVLRQRSHRRRL